MLEQLKSLTALIDEPERTGCLQLLNDHQDRILISPGSKHKHQAWPGGYIGHLVDIMRTATVTYPIWNAIHPLPFSLSDALLTLYFHDKEKPFKYVEPKEHFVNDAAKLAFIVRLAEQYGITFTDDQYNALKYVHGEGTEHNSTTRVQGPLGAFIHCFDNASARIWPHEPIESKLS